MRLIANVIGATGLVGKQLVKMLLEDERFEKITIFVRRDSGIRHQKLEQHIVDFAEEKTWGKYLNGNILFSTLGTTLKQAGSKEKEYEVDFTFNLNFAKKAKENGIENYVLISSIGANSRSNIFYTRMKGELDEAVQKIGFKKLSILRPSSLIGKREEQRWNEKISLPVLQLVTRFILKKYRPIEDSTVAHAMIKAALNTEISNKIWEGDEIYQFINLDS